MISVDDPDAELLDKAQNGDELGFSELVLKYRNRVMGVAARMLGNRVDAEDVAQEVFVKVHNGLKDFKRESLFSTWLYRITANSCLNDRRKRARERQGGRVLEESEPWAPDPAFDPHAALERRELTRLLEQAIQALPEEQRIVLLLRDIEGLSYEDIAESLEIELGTVRSRLHRARAGVQGSMKQALYFDDPRSETP
jgi:RNA polymerase sigma-70 factor (ECF subfamily)